MKTTEEIEARINAYLEEYKELRFQLISTADLDEWLSFGMRISIVVLQCTELYWVLGRDIEVKEIDFPEIVNY